MLRREFSAHTREPQQKHGIRFTTGFGLRPPDAWQAGNSSPRRPLGQPGSSAAPSLASAAAAAAAAARLPSTAGRTAAATSTASALSYELDIGDLLVGHDWGVVRSARHAVHSVERLEQRLQRRAVALPAGVRRLLAGGIAGAAGKQALVNVQPASDCRRWLEGCPAPGPCCQSGMHFRCMPPPLPAHRFLPSWLSV